MTMFKYHFILTTSIEFDMRGGKSGIARAQEEGSFLRPAAAGVPNRTSARLAGGEARQPCVAKLKLLRNELPLAASRFPTQPNVVEKCSKAKKLLNSGHYTRGRKKAVVLRIKGRWEPLFL